MQVDPPVVQPHGKSHTIKLERILIKAVPNKLRREFCNRINACPDMLIACLRKMKEAFAVIFPFFAVFEDFQHDLPADALVECRLDLPRVPDQLLTDLNRPGLVSSNAVKNGTAVHRCFQVRRLCLHRGHEKAVSPRHIALHADGDHAAVQP